MNVITIPKKQYKNLVERQERVEKELIILRELIKIIKTGIEGKHARKTTLKKWERISRDLDRGKGLVFSSAADMRAWLGRL